MSATRASFEYETLFEACRVAPSVRLLAMCSIVERPLIEVVSA